jgi:hypothetical protein
VALDGFHVESIGGACPTQATGLCADGRPFYFRAKYGEWTLSVGPEGADTDGDWIGIIAWDRASGSDPTQGRMADQDVLAILRAHLGQRLDG